MTKIISQKILNQTATGAQTSIITEPSLAVSGKRIIVAGNWFSSRSTNSGKKWRFIDPFTELPPTGAGLCCDQMVHYSKSKRLWIWILQFRKSNNGNIVRVAVSSTGASGSWTWWDTAPADLNSTWVNSWFDYPDLIETKGKLLLSFNMFTVSNDLWVRSVVLRFSMSALKAKGILPRQAWSTNQVGSLRFARGPGNGAYFASHSESVAALVIFKWQDNSNTVTENTVLVTDWSNGPYQSNGPGGIPWLLRVDDRITGGWRSKGILGFAWSAASDTNHSHPYVRTVRVRESSMVLIDEPDLWSDSCTWAYPALIPNKRGDVGITAFCGGNSNHPAHAVGWFNEQLNSWEMITSAISSHGPNDGMWGDYLDIQADPRRRTYWIASGFILNGGRSQKNILPRIVTFKP